MIKTLGIIGLGSIGQRHLLVAKKLWPSVNIVAIRSGFGRKFNNHDLIHSIFYSLEEAIDNIRADREVTKELLDDVLQYIGKNEANHREVGVVAAKYVETLQRSNEQLVKVSSLMQKREVQSGDFKIDSEQIYDILNTEES